MKANKWIAHENVTEGNKLSLLCFIFDGGSASYFSAWKYSLNEDNISFRSIVCGMGCTGLLVFFVLDDYALIGELYHLINDDVLAATRALCYLVNELLHLFAYADMCAVLKLIP